MINFRTILVVTITLILATIAYLFFTHKPAAAPSNHINNQTQNSPAPPQFKGQEEVLKNALNLYAKKKQEGANFTNGPCLGKIADDWVLDIVHNPRQPVDDRKENQCAEYGNGSAHHFIELDESGNLIRAL